VAGWRYVGDLPLLVPGSLSSEAYQFQMQWPVWNRALSENGRVVAGSRHGMYESVFKTAGEQQGNGMVCVNLCLKRQENSRGMAWYVWICV
jgi:hypothetical protein